MSGRAVSFHPVDVATGVNIRRLRRARGLTQEWLATRIGLTFQQVQKYERGANRISCSRLMDIARALHVAPSALLPEADWLAEEAPSVWPRQAEELYLRHTRLFEALTPLKARQLNALRLLAETMAPD
jgi:transcriptional regulator with XRE-family HTH domain